MLLREHQRAQEGPRWDDAERVVTAREVAAIARYQTRHGYELLRPGFRCVKATSWVGVIGVSQHCIEVVPKIDGTDDARARGNLHWMVARSGLLPLAEADAAPLANAGKPLVVAYMQLYVRRLAREWRRGPVRSYVAEETNRLSLRGKLLLPEQARVNAVHLERFYTRADEFTVDNDVARLFKAALCCCNAQQAAGDLSRDARSLLLDFDEVSDIAVTADDASRIDVDRRHAHFAPLVRMARCILEHVSPSPSHAEPVYSLMFDMNVVFERFVAKVLRRALAVHDCEVMAQRTGGALLRQDGRKRFLLRPDVEVRRGGKCVCLVDTKWKRLDLRAPHADVSQADVYQAYAYGKEYRSPRTVLLYPRTGSQPEVVATYSHNDAVANGTDPPQVVVATIDVSTPLSQPDAARTLERALVKVCGV